MTEGTVFKIQSDPNGAKSVLFAADLEKDFAGAWAVKFAKEDCLPGAKMKGIVFYQNLF
jgi:hypothetical protein